MSEEEKVDTSTTEKKEDVKTTETQQDPQDDNKVETDEGGEKTENLENKKDEVDWKKVAEDEQAKRERAENALAHKRFKSKGSKDTEDKTEVEDDPDERPLTVGEAKALVERQQRETAKTLYDNRARELAKSLAGSDDEANAIYEKWRNTPFSTETPLEEQIEDTHLILNKKRILGENNELKRAVAGKSGTNTDSASTHHEKPRGTEPKMSSVDQEELIRTGFKWNPTSRRYEKKLSNGQTLIRDPKLKQVRILQ